MAIGRVLRNIRNAIPSGVGLGRLSAGDGPVEFIPLSEYQKAALDAISATRGSILYRGAAGWAGLAPGTSGHFLKTNGAGADPAWAASSGGQTELDYSPPTTSTLSTERKTAASFTASASDATGKGLLLSMNPTGAGEKVIARLKAAPSTPFTITVRGRHTLHSNGEFGIMLHNSSNGRNLRILMLASGQFFSQQWSAIDAFNATIASSPVAYPDFHSWMRITVDGGGNVSFFFSVDGAFFKACGTTTLATYLTAAGGSLDEVGVHGRINGSGGTSGACFHYYAES